MDYMGIIIEESLHDPSILKRMRILSTKVEWVTAHHQTPWLQQWTLHTVSIPANEMHDIAKVISQALEERSSWYADFKNDKTHYIVYRGRVFTVDRSKKEEYDAATAYGIAQGIPKHQVDFSPDVQQWTR